MVEAALDGAGCGRIGDRGPAGFTAGGPRTGRVWSSAVRRCIPATSMPSLFRVSHTAGTVNTVVGGVDAADVCKVRHRATREALIELTVVVGRWASATSSVSCVQIDSTPPQTIEAHLRWPDRR